MSKPHKPLPHSSVFHVKHLIATATVLALMAVAARADEPWWPVARQCMATLSAHARCGSCFAYWPAVAACTARQVRPKATPAMVRAAITAVNERYFRAPQSVDRVALVIHRLPK